MTDERYVFQQTERERKRLSRGAYSKKNGSKSRMCRLPSDGMTKAEKQALNGEVMKYELSKPMNWKQFKAMPKDIQKEYLQKLTDDIGASRKDIAEMFGIKAQQLSDYLLINHKGEYYFRGKKRNQEAFLKWFCGETEKEPEKLPECVAEKEIEKESVSLIEMGELEFCGSAKEIFENMIRFLDDKVVYRIRIGFKREVSE